MILRFFAVFVAIVCATVAMAQTQDGSQFQRLDIRDGLPSQQVNAITQDRAGHLWIGTKDGLARYDGRAFKVYRHAPGDMASLPSNYIGALHADNKGRLWVAVEGHGVFRLNDSKTGFARLQLQSGSGNALDIWAIVSDSAGSVWFASFGDGLFRLKPDGSIQHFLPNAKGVGLPDANVLSLAFSDDGTLWIATSSGIVLWKNERFIAFDNSRLSSKVVINLMPDTDFGMWLGTQAGLNLAKSDGTVENPVWQGQHISSRVIALLKGRDGTRWFVGAKGISRLQDGKLHPVFPDQMFITAFQDTQDGFWLGSDKGLIRQPKGWRYFKTFQKSGDDQGMQNAKPWDYQVLADGSVLIVGDAGKIDRMQPSTGALQQLNYRAPDNRGKDLRSVLQDSQGQLWLGGALELMRVPKANALADVWTTESNTNPTLLGPVRHLLQTPDGMVWAGFYGGGLQARTMEGDVVYSIRPQDGKGLQYPDPEQLLVGPDNVLWLAGGEGLLRWNAGSAQFKAVAGAPKGRIFSARLDNDRTLWLGQLGQLGQYRWNPSEQALQALVLFNGDDGLPAVEISGIAKDARGALWLSTSRGLVRFNRKDKRARLYGINDGLISQEFDVRAPYISPGGQAFALTKTGIVSFRPEEMLAAPEPLRLVLEQVSVRRGEDDIRLDANTALRIGPDDRDLSIDVLLLNFDDVAAHRYRSRLLGYDPDWVEMGNSGNRVFSSLPDGHYRLQLIAAGAEGVWSEPILVQFDVLPPVWKTWWAFLVYAMALLMVMWGLLWANRSRLKRKHAQQLAQQQQELLLKNSESKSLFLANLGHEIRTPMTGVLGMTELLMAGPLDEKPKAQILSIKKAGEHLLRLMNDALDLSKIEAGQFELDNQAFSLHDVLSDVHELLLPLARQKGLALTLEVAPQLHPGYLGDAGRIRQILFNLGSNAIKFTAEGGVIIKAQCFWPKGVMLSVLDSGPGMTEEQQRKLFQRFVQADGIKTAQQYGGSGLGLAICKELAALMQGDIQIESEPGRGSTFTVCLPLDAVDDVPEAMPQSTARISPDTMPGYRLLLVEDDETIVQVISTLLSAQGHSVVCARHALEAMAQTVQHAFDAIFCDLDLPGMSGLELTKLWREQGLQTPVIALTARTQSDAEQQCLEAGMSSFLRKPVSGDQLQQALLRAVLN